MDIRIDIAGEGANGAITIDLFEDVAPNHVTQIVTLAETGLYDGVVFHRVIDGFVAQTGDVQFGRLDGDLGRAGTGSSDLPDLKAEFSEISFDRGIVGMARASDPDSANSQFFIMLDDASYLNGQYTVVGRVTSGIAIVDDIKLGFGPNGTVLGTPDVMQSVSVIDAPPPDVEPIVTDWVLEGNDEDGNSFTGEMTFQSQVFDPATGRTALQGVIDWLANDSLAFSVAFEADRHVDGRLEFTYVENASNTAGVIPALYNAQFSTGNRAISAYYDGTGVVAGTWWAMPASTGIRDDWSRVQDRIDFVGDFIQPIKYDLREFDENGELKILSELMRLYHDSPSARSDLDAALLQPSADGYMGQLEIGAVADGSGSRHFASKDSNRIYIDLTDPVDRTFLGVDGQPIKLSLGSVIFHEFRHAFEDYSSLYTLVPEIERANVSIRFDDPGFDHLGSVVRRTNEIRAELGEDLRGSYVSLTGLDDVMKGLDFFSDKIGAMPGSYDQAVLFFDPDSSTPTWSSVGAKSGAGASKDFVLAVNSISDIRTGAGGDAVVNLAGPMKVSLGGGEDWALGGGRRDIIKGNGGRDTIDPGAGRDVLSGGRGFDTFVFGDDYGVNRIRDFNANARAEDIVLSDVTKIRSFRDLVDNHLEQKRGNAVIDDHDGTKIILVGIDIADLDRSDFVF